MCAALQSYTWPSRVKSMVSSGFAASSTIAHSLSTTADDASLCAAAFGATPLRYYRFQWIHTFYRRSPALHGSVDGDDEEYSARNEPVKHSRHASPGGYDCDDCGDDVEALDHRHYHTVARWWTRKISNLPEHEPEARKKMWIEEM